MPRIECIDLGRGVEIDGDGDGNEDSLREDGILKKSLRELE